MDQEWKTSEEEADVLSAAFSPDGRRLATGGEDESVCVWDFEAEGHRKLARPLLDEEVRGLAFSPDGRRIAAGNGGRLAMLDVEAARPIFEVKTSAYRVEAIAFAPDGRRVATGGMPGQLWNADTGRAAGVLDDHEDSVQALAFLPDGRLASVDSSSNLLVRQPPEGG